MRRELAGLFGQFELSLDANKVEQIINEGRMEIAAPSAVAERIVKAATVLDRREARILRALLDDDGRAIYSYQTDYYRHALESLLGKAYLRKVDLC